VQKGKLKTTGVLRLNKRRLLQPSQAYHVLTYESKWKTEIDREWQAYTTSWAKEHPGEVLKKTRFEFMNTFIKAKYDAETPEMKVKVEEYRQSISAQAPDEINRGFQMSVSPQSRYKLRTHQIYCSAIDKLPRSIASVAQSIQEQTGWCVTIMVGGPLPREQGRLTTLV